MSTDVHACKDGRNHKFDMDSGWCLQGCGNRDDGHVIAVRGGVVRTGYQYTSEELAEMRARIDPSGEG